MKNPISTKDLGALNELIIFEQWACTKYAMLIGHTTDKELHKVFNTLCAEHQKRRDVLLKYLKSNAKAGE